MMRWVTVNGTEYRWWTSKEAVHVTVPGRLLLLKRPSKLGWLGRQYLDVTAPYVRQGILDNMHTEATDARQVS
jgi:hypothetical protein